MKLSILVVSHNTRDLLSRCLSSIDRFPSRFPFEVWVVDNDSSDGSAAMIRDHHPSVHVIENESNIGFGAANNQALILASGEFVLFLNSDTRIQNGTLDALIAAIDADPSLGAVGPRLIDTHGRIEPSFGKRPTFARDARRKLEARLYERGNRFVSTSIERRHQLAQDTDWLSAACLITRASLLDELGGFDERFFLYMEDVDLCIRMQNAGYRLRFDPQIEIGHIRGASSATSNAKKERAKLEGIRSRILFYGKHQSRMQQMLLRFYLLLRRHRFTDKDIRHRYEEILAGGPLDN